MIPEELLKHHKAAIIHLHRNDMLFQHGDSAVSFYIVKTGKIKMSAYSNDGKEFVQGYFTDGQSFGEPPFFSGTAYPASAVAVEESAVWKISRADFLQLLKENFDLILQLMQTLCHRLIYKSTMLTEIATQEAEHRLITLIQYLVEHTDVGPEGPVKISFTRQQLADMTGLRVETVIRSVKSLEQKRMLEIGPDGKILWNRISR
jgi:CRP-like cAMP-binding protein